MARTISQRELRNGSGEVMRALDEGQTFVITRNGVPVGELSPIERRRFVAKEQLLRTFSNLPEIDPDRFREDVDRYMDQDATPRA